MCDINTNDSTHSVSRHSIKVNDLQATHFGVAFSYAFVYQANVHPCMTAGLVQYNERHKWVLMYLGIRGTKGLENDHLIFMGGGGEILKPGDQWSCKCSPDIWAKYKHKTYKTWKKQGQEMTLTFNIHL